MPTNLPAEYYEVDERYRAATDPQQKAALLEELISTIPKHKGTDHLRADLRQKLSKLKAQAETKKSTGKHVTPYHIDREGEAQVAVIGPPNSGKSALVKALTNAEPEVADFPFSTWGPTPGMMIYRYVQIQLIDTPPLNPEYIEPAFVDMLRRADLLLVLLDLQHPDPFGQLDMVLAYLETNHIALERQRAEIAEPRRYWFKPALLVVNKVDNPAADEDFVVLQELLGEEPELLPVSVENVRYMPALQQAIFDRLGLMCIYSQPPGQEADRTAPFVLKIGGTVEDFAGKVHKDFLDNLKSARVWGSSAFPGQEVARDFVLHDGDIVELKM